MVKFATAMCKTKGIIRTLGSLLEKKMSIVLIKELLHHLHNSTAQLLL